MIKLGIERYDEVPGLKLFYHHADSCPVESRRDKKTQEHKA